MMSPSWHRVWHAGSHRLGQALTTKCRASADGRGHSAPLSPPQGFSISFLQKFRPPPKLPKFAKFRHYWMVRRTATGEVRCPEPHSFSCSSPLLGRDRRRWLPIPPQLTATWAQTPHLAPARAPSRTMIRRNLHLIDNVPPQESKPGTLP